MPGDRPKNEKQDEKQRVAFFSLLAAFALTTIKLAVGLHTHSLGILSEALHSGLDLLAAALTLLAVKVASRPADEGHTYGHGKAENLSALAQTVLLLLTCGWVTWEGVERLAEGASPIQPSVWGVGVMLLSILVDANRVRILRRVAQRNDSQALEADALHFSTDILSSIVVLAGVLTVWITDVLHAPASLTRILSQADTVAALLVAVIIFFTSLRMAKAAINSLMDAAPDNMAEEVRKKVLTVPGVMEVDSLRIRKSGPQYFVEMRLGVPSQQNIEDAHTLSHAAEKAVRTLLPEADVTIHIEPRTLPKTQDVFEHIRAAASSFGLRVHHIHIYGKENPRYLDLHTELPAEMVNNFEQILSSQLPGLEIVSHIEPEYFSEKECGPIPIYRANLLRREVMRVTKNQPHVLSVQDILLFELPELGTSLSFKCLVPQGLTVYQAHNVSKCVEQALIESVPKLGRVIIHLEPESQTFPL